MASSLFSYKTRVGFSMPATAGLPWETGLEHPILFAPGFRVPIPKAFRLKAQGCPALSQKGQNWLEAIS